MRVHKFIPYKDSFTIEVEELAAKEFKILIINHVKREVMILNHEVTSLDNAVAFAKFEIEMNWIPS